MARAKNLKKQQESGKKNDDGLTPQHRRERWESATYPWTMSRWSHHSCFGTERPSRRHDFDSNLNLLLLVLEMPLLWLRKLLLRRRKRRKAEVNNRTTKIYIIRVQVRWKFTKFTSLFAKMENHWLIDTHLLHVTLLMPSDFRWFILQRNFFLLDLIDISCNCLLPSRQDA